ncbi:TfoX/Sxy family protein [Sandarakinorhabdus limnophila]|uniref:TfoX/Sxy family protein n=1 Tax=Sandarakinorhabdus limnophila TaxID=210512 RepID=UPI0034C6D976
MSSDPRTIAFIVDQAGGAASEVTARAMFGEYGLYLEGKLVALVCDDQLFVKPTIGGRAYASDAGEAPARTSASAPGWQKCSCVRC